MGGVVIKREIVRAARPGVHDAPKLAGRRHAQRRVNLPTHGEEPPPAAVIAAGIKARIMAGVVDTGAGAFSNVPQVQLSCAEARILLIVRFPVGEHLQIFEDKVPFLQMPGSKRSSECPGSNQSSAPQTSPRKAG